MSLIKWIGAMGASIILTAVSFAQAPATQTSGGEGKETVAETDAIFDEILQNLPGQLRAEVDSAKRAGALSLQAPDADAERERSEERERLREEGLNELPEQLRLQVEKTIDRMENNLQQRQLQFKEQKGEMSGKK